MFSLKNIAYDYSSGTDPIIVDRLDADQGSVWTLLGSSGSGKTTVLNLLSGLILPKHGTVEVCGKHLSKLSEQERDLFRGEYIGIVFQTNHLLATLTVQENLQLVRFVNQNPQNIEEIENALSRLDISSLADRYPESLSEGQKQRVAIARSLVNNPKLIIADEPTSSLDDRNTELVLNLLFSEAERIDATLLVATHDQRVKDRIENVFNLDEG